MRILLRCEIMMQESVFESNFTLTEVCIRIDNGSPVKVCDIVQFYGSLSGGVKRFIQDKMRFFAGTEDIEHIVIVPARRQAITREWNSRVYGIASLPLVGSQSYRMLLNRKAILDIIQRERPDVLEVGDPYRAAWIAEEARRIHHIPVVAYYHSDFPRALGRTLRRFAGPLAERICNRHIERYLTGLYNRLDATVVASDWCRNHLQEIGVNRVIRIPLGTDTEVFAPRDSREMILGELGLNHEARLLLYCGRLAREKNIRRLLEMIDLVAERHPLAHLLLVGDGELRHMVQGHARRNPRVSWRPYCEDVARLCDLYSAAELLVHGGQIETFGLVSIEAQACGTPVIAVRRSGISETIVDQEPLTMAVDARPESLAEAVIQGLDRPRAPGHRQRRREQIRQRFCWRHTYQQLSTLYRFLSAGRGAVLEPPQLPFADELFHPPLPSRRS
jgi:alpha-1,6-mannosyltransferase